MPKKILTEGAPGRALCGRCHTIVALTYRYRNVALDEDEHTSTSVLAGVCDLCDHVVSIAPQATPAIKRARLAARPSVSALLPPPFLRALHNASAIIDPDAMPDLPKRLLLHYVDEFSSGQRDLRRLHVARHAALSDFTDAAAQPLKRYTILMSDAMAAAFAQLRGATWMSTTMLLKCLVAEIRHDVIDAATPERLQALRDWCAGPDQPPSPAGPAGRVGLLTPRR